MDVLILQLCVFLLSANTFWSSTLRMVFTIKLDLINNLDDQKLIIFSNLQNNRERQKLRKLRNVYVKSVFNKIDIVFCFNPQFNNYRYKRYN
jgi:hypothetical protein